MYSSARTVPGILLRIRKMQKRLFSRRAILFLVLISCLPTSGGCIHPTVHPVVTEQPSGHRSLRSNMAFRNHSTMTFLYLWPIPTRPLYSSTTSAEASSLTYSVATSSQSVSGVTIMRIWPGTYPFPLKMVSRRSRLSMASRKLPSPLKVVKPLLKVRTTT